MVGLFVGHEMIELVYAQTKLFPEPLSHRTLDPSAPNALLTSSLNPIHPHQQALGRPTRIVRGKIVDPSWVVTEDLFECDEERALYSALKATKARIEQAAAAVAGGGSRGAVGVGELLDACGELVAPIDAFFEKVELCAQG